MSQMRRYRLYRKRSGASRGRPRGIFDLCLAVAILGMLALVVGRVDRAAVRHEAGSVIVNDGDTITLNGQRIRLLGIDAPEYNQTCVADDGSYRCGRQAREALVKLIAGRVIACEGGKRDRYDRLLAICKIGTLDLNRAMVEQGWAVAYGDYGDAQRTAKARQAGIWAGTFERPRDWRASRNIRDEPAPAGFLDWLWNLFDFSGVAL